MKISWSEKYYSNVAFSTVNGHKCVFDVDSKEIYYNGDDSVYCPVAQESITFPEWEVQDIQWVTKTIEVNTWEVIGYTQGKTVSSSSKNRWGDTSSSSTIVGGHNIYKKVPIQLTYPVYIWTNGKENQSFDFGIDAFNSAEYLSRHGEKSEVTFVPAEKDVEARKPQPKKVVINFSNEQIAESMIKWAKENLEKAIAQKQEMILAEQQAVTIAQKAIIENPIEGINASVSSNGKIYWYANAKRYEVLPEEWLEKAKASRPLQSGKVKPVLRK